MSEKEVIKTASWLYKTEGGETVLVGNKCKVCGNTMFPAQEQCSVCLKKDLEECSFEKEGVLYSCATVHAAPAGFEGPYTLGYGDFGELRIFGMVVGSEEPQIGDKLKIIEGKLRETEEATYVGYQFQVIKEGK